MMINNTCARSGVIALVMSVTKYESEDCIWFMVFELEMSALFLVILSVNVRSSYLIFQHIDCELC